MEARLAALRRRFRTLGVANFVVTKLSNIRYLCEFTGSNGLLLVTGKDAYFVTDGRYTNQARQQVGGAQVFIYTPAASNAESFTREMKVNREINFRGRIGIEATVMAVDLYQALRRTFPSSQLVETDNVVDDLAMVKDDGEIALIRKAVNITDKVFESVLGDIKPGISEKDIAAEITYRQQKLGAEKDGFDAIVASGPRSALPHGIASNRKIKKGDFVTLDFGCVYEGYPSDMTRTVVVGKASAEQKKIYSIVKEAQARGVEAVKSGIRCADVDAAARDVINRTGYGPQFSHGTGHGLGLWDRVKEVHARPVLSPLSKDRLKTGMVVTIEPGIYVEGFGGVRIEDDVVVRDGGCEVLTKSSKELLEL